MKDHGNGAPNGNGNGAPNGNGNGVYNVKNNGNKDVKVSAKLERVSSSSSGSKIPGLDGVYKMAQNLTKNFKGTPSGNTFPVVEISDRTHLAASKHTHTAPATVFVPYVSVVGSHYRTAVERPQQQSVSL
jgi:hypothetical protein